VALPVLLLPLLPSVLLQLYVQKLELLLHVMLLLHVLGCTRCER
jgi:hypothetical protein